MSDTDLELVDLDSDDPFDFSVDDWIRTRRWLFQDTSGQGLRRLRSRLQRPAEVTRGEGYRPLNRTHVKEYLCLLRLRSSPVLRLESAASLPSCVPTARFDLWPIAADAPAIHTVAAEFSATGVGFDAVERPTSATIRGRRPLV